MGKFSKNLRVFALILLLSAFSAAAISSNNATVKAAGNAYVDIIASVGGTTDPAPSFYNFSGGSDVIFTAFPRSGFVFQNWEIVTSSGATIDTTNPVTVKVSAGENYTIQAIFQPIQIPSGGKQVETWNMNAIGIVVILPSIGGTTSPTSGTYALGNTESLELTANSADGFKFDHWVIGSTFLDNGTYSFIATSTNNPYVVDNGYGNTYTYQPVFTPIVLSTQQPTSTSIATQPPATANSSQLIDIFQQNALAIIIGLFAVIIIVVIVIIVLKKKKSKVK